MYLGTDIYPSMKKGHDRLGKRSQGFQDLFCKRFGFGSIQNPRYDF